MKHIKGPDFPTGGYIVGREGIKDAYETGRGRVVMRGRAHVEPLRGGKEAIIVTELPFMVKKGGKGNLIDKIADLVRDKKISEISDLRDETDRSGMRLVIELKRDAIPEVVLNKLYKHTSLQQTFGVNMVALADGVPRTLDLREVIRYYVLHQKEVVTRRTKDELQRAERRAHILEGLLIALSNIDAVIKLIRSSPDPEQARAGLIEQFELSAEQAQAILDMRLQRLTALETDKIKSEHADLMERIKELRAILGDEERLYGLIKEELLEIKEIYGDERRSEIIAAEGEVDLEDMIAEEQMVISITRSGYIKRLPLSTYRKQHRGGVGVIGMETKEDDYIEHLRICSTHDFLLFFTNMRQGLPAEGLRAARGRAHRQGPCARQPAAAARGRARARRDPDARLLRAQVRRVRHAQGPDQEDRADRLQHADPRGRDHRDQAARRRRARRRARHERRGRHHHGVALRLRGALQRVTRAADGPRHLAACAG